LNLRAEALRNDFENFNRPSGTSPGSAFCPTSGADTSNDFRCITYRSNSPEGTRFTSTYVTDITQVDPVTDEPILTRVPRGDRFQGLSMQEYTYQIYSVARKGVALDSNGRITENSPVEGIMEMRTRSRLIPMFQFAAFYNNDLEISPGPPMQLNGPIHTNKNLMLAGWDSSQGLKINGQITVGNGEIYNAVVQDNCGNNCTVRSRTNANGRVQLLNSNNVWVNLLQIGSGSTIPTSEPLLRFRDSVIKAANGLGSLVEVGIDPVIVPAFNSTNNFLSCGSTDRQNICSRADINVMYSPPAMANTSSPSDLELAIVPFSVTARNQADNGTLTSARMASLGELRSLRQPVLVTTATSGTVGPRIPGARGSVSATKTADNLSGVCAADNSTALTELQTWLNHSSRTTQRALINDNREQIQDALRVALVSQLRPVEFSRLGNNLLSGGATVPATAPDLVNGDLTSSVVFRFRESLVTRFGGSANATAVNRANDIISALRRGSNSNALPSMRVIASIAGGSCFVSAPFQEVLRFYNDREGRNIRLLQMNIASLTIWNRDGRYVIFNGSGLSTDTIFDTNSGRGLTAATPLTVPPAGLPPSVCPNPIPEGVTCNNGTFSSTDGVRSFLFKLLDAEGTAPVDSFQRFGYAAADRSHGGMAVHFTMGSSYAYTERESPYGFALTGGRQLFGRARYNGYNQNPAGVTFASNQAIYTQGDLNNFLEDPNDSTFNITNSSAITGPATLVWQPASILADSINVLSNACRSLPEDRILKTGGGKNCNGQSGASPTTTRTGFLAGTDITGSDDVKGFSGGMQNYPRYFEDWGGDVHVYAGSFVSLGTPLEVSGSWDAQNGNYNPPQRVWGYETRFNDAANLPPLAPRFVTLQQEIFRRRFSQ
jgi:hypothetical protein